MNCLGKLLSLLLVPFQQLDVMDMSTQFVLAFWKKFSHLWQNRTLGSVVVYDLTVLLYTSKMYMVMGNV